ncbi:DUF2911 domain-containing protein [Pontimicrobium sp. MEBiC01747]
MKKSSFFTATTFVFMTLLSFSVNAQNFSGLDKSPMDVASFPTSYKESNKLVKVTYSRPQLKGRALSKLAPNGKVWRTGANEAAEITLYTDMKLGGTTVKAGTYSLFTIPGDKEWTIILSTDINVWGSYFYNEANDVARINVPATTGKESLEAFSMAFEKSKNGLDLHMGWGTLRVTVPFTK